MMDSLITSGSYSRALYAYSREYIVPASVGGAVKDSSMLEKKHYISYVGKEYLKVKEDSCPGSKVVGRIT
jgi:hypothetical protein